MRLLDHETLLSERVRGTDRVGLTTQRIYQQSSTIFGRAHFISIPLEKLDSIEERVRSKPWMLGFGALLVGLGWNFSGSDFDSAAVAIAIGAMFVAGYILSRRRGAHFRAATAEVFLQGSSRDVADFIFSVEDARWNHVKALFDRRGVSGSNGTSSSPGLNNPIRPMSGPFTGLIADEPAD